MFDTVIDIDPQDAGAWCNKGVSFGLLGWLEEAVECFEIAIDINSHHASSCTQRHHSLEAQT